MTDIAPEAVSAPAQPFASSNPLAAVEHALQAAEQAATCRGARIESAISAWLSTHLSNSPVSRSTEAWNHLVSVLPALTAQLKDL